MAISNIFNNYFSSIANTSKLYFFHFRINIFQIFLKINLIFHFFVSLTNKTEIENVISSLDSNKSVGPNSIPTKVLNNLK